eukprot:483682-Prymnesium_polylepis.1
MAALAHCTAGCRPRTPGTRAQSPRPHPHKPDRETRGDRADRTPHKTHLLQRCTLAGALPLARSPTARAHDARPAHE